LQHIPQGTVDPAEQTAAAQQVGHKVGDSALRMACVYILFEIGIKMECAHHGFDTFDWNFID
jgi:hypothetical protein